MFGRKKDKKAEPKPDRAPIIGGAGEIVFDIVLLALGIILIVWPVNAAIVLTRTVGVVILILAILEFVVFIRSNTKDAFEIAGLIFGVLLAAGGIWLIVNPDWLVQFFNIMFGVVIGLYGLFGIVSAVGYSRKGGGLWWIGLILSIVAIALAVLIFMNPFATPKMLMIIIGVSLITSAVTGIYNTIRIRRARKLILGTKAEFDSVVPDAVTFKDIGSDEEER